MQVKNIARNLLIQDCIDLCNAIFCTNEKDRAVFMLGAMPYICLVVNEAYEWCKRDSIALSKFESKSIMENIRAKAKLFSGDKYIPFEQQIAEYKNVVCTEHKYFKGLAKPFCPDFLIDNIGTYRIGDTYIGNTIQYAYDFNVFRTIDKSIYESGKEINSFAVEIGTAIQEIITLLTEKPYKIKSNNSNSKEHDTVDFNFARTFKQIEKLRSCIQP